MRDHGCGWPVAAAALCVLLAAPPAVQAQADRVGQASAAERQQQAVISADEIAYDDAAGAVIANGNVEIAHGGRLLLADEVRYDQSGDSVVASGNVSILEPTGEVIFADRVELSDGMRDGVVENIRILLADDSRFAANGARRISGKKTVMRRAVFSPCEVCQGDPERPPLWQLKAGTIVHDQEAQDVSYRNAWLEFLGVPVAYTPYLSHPDPTVDRRSGILSPTFGSSTVFGGYVRLPVFWAITPSMDATVEPIVTTKERPILALEYRQHVTDGLYTISGSVTKADRETGDPGNPVIEDAVRGHAFGRGRFDISDHWRWGFDGEWASDRTYLDRYDFFGDPEDTLESNLFVEGFYGRSYAAGNLFAYQDLRLTDPVEEPYVLPLLDYNYVGEADGIGGRWSVDTNFRSTVRENGPNTRRLSVKTGYLLPMVADFGLATTVSASVQADGYHLDGVDVGGVTENNLLEGRVIPRLAVQFRYPFVRGGTGTRQVIEPIAAVVVTPSAGNPGNIPEEDSVVIELDDTNLLSEDRIPGLDRADLGQRAVYGVKAGLYGDRGGRLTAFVGQSYRRPDKITLATTSDIEQGRSDFVGRVDLVANKYFDLLYRFRLAENDFDLLRSELGAAMGPPAFRLTGDYIFIASEASAGVFPDREEVSGQLSSQLTDFWRISANTRRDLSENGGPLEHGARITYEDECFRLEAKFRRDFTETVDTEKETAISIELVFKTLGTETAQQVDIR